ncbi:MAG: hypothetical protein J7507_01365, partial [Pseudoxanthomonas sp.]|nr:hypothetical protein [Pseudoxanthomonas sp.]
MHRAILFLACLSAVGLAVSPPASAAAPVSPVAQADQPLGAVVDAQTMRVVNRDAELRTVLGISGDGIDLSGQLNDVSLPQREILRTTLRNNLAELDRYAASHGISGQDRWSLGLMRWLYQR